MKIMNYLIVILLMLSSILVFIPNNARAETVTFGTDGYYSYGVTDSGYTIIYDYNGSESHQVIPSTVNGHTVSQVGVYYGNESWLPPGTHHVTSIHVVTSLVIPDSVKLIGLGAFESCENLVSVDFPVYAQYTDSCFAYCTSLTNISLNGGTLHNAFASCTSLRYVSLGSVTWISGAFNGDISIYYITIPGTVNFIGIWSFANCDNLVSLNFTGMVAPTIEGDSYGYPSTWIYGTIGHYVLGHAQNGSDFPPPGSYFHGLLMGDELISLPPTITSTPQLTIGMGGSYSYNVTADQPGGSWTYTLPTWLSIGPHTGVAYALIHGTAPGIAMSSTVRLVYTDTHGSAWQNFSITVWAIDPHFVSVTIWKGSNHTSVATWYNTNNGVYIAVAGTQIDGVSAVFMPTYTYPVTMAFQVRIYDNITLLYGYQSALVVSDGNVSTKYSFTSVNNAAVSTLAGHMYYVQVNMVLTNSTGYPLPTEMFSGTITTSVPASTQQNWINGIIWILLLFSVPFILNQFFPRVGFLLGMIMVGILFGIANPSFLYVTLIIVVVVSVEGYALSKTGV